MMEEEMGTKSRALSWFRSAQPQTEDYSEELHP